MRDLVITLIVLGSLPPTLAMPHIGILMWSWLSFMNPHRLSWGFAFNFPFAQLVAITTLMGWVISREPKSIPWNRVTMLMVALVVWINVTTLFTLVPEGTYPLWDRAMKMLLMTFVALALMRTRERINLLVWVIALSIGFFGVKGGVFTLLTGGQYLVIGPPHSHISDNNTLAAALIMILPLMRYLQLTTEKWWVRMGLWGAMGLSICAALGSYSRGAFLTLGVLTAIMVLRSRRRFVLTVGLTLLLAGGVT
ncbi:MAG: putative O-glycosylation ligase, exosortase A system-associated, partial [Alphaproteobacteria bacterium]